jgi:hypothetical protein
MNNILRIWHENVSTIKAKTPDKIRPEIWQKASVIKDAYVDYAGLPA